MSNKLTCKKHHRRVIVVPSPRSESGVVVIHRHGEYVRCDSSIVTINGKEYLARDFIFQLTLTTRR